MPATTAHRAAVALTVASGTLLAACNLPGELATDAAEQHAAASAIIAAAEAEDRPLTPGEAAAVAALREGADLSRAASDSLLGLSDATIGGVAAAVLAALGVWGGTRSRKASRLGRVIEAASKDDERAAEALKAAATAQKVTPPRRS